MPNVLLTQKCVRSCPYCFARKHMHDAPPDDILQWEDLIYIVDFFKSGGDSNISLLGGEPLLHPDIADYILYIINRGMHVTVFTSGITTEQRLSELDIALQYVDPDDLSIVVNLNDPRHSPERENEAISRFLTCMSRFSCLSINVFKLNFDYSFALQCINTYGLQRHVRLGLAHPIPGKGNVCIPADKMRDMAAEFMAYLPTFEAFGITVGFDCGVPMCAFTDAELGRLYKHTRGMINFSCGPAVDIGPDLMVWACFPLGNYQKRSLLEFQDVQDMTAYLNDLHEQIRIEQGGLYPECDSCEARLRKLCSGGCLTHCLDKFLGEAHIRPEFLHGGESV